MASTPPSRWSPPPRPRSPHPLPFPARRELAVGCGTAEVGQRYSACSGPLGLGLPHPIIPVGSKRGLSARSPCRKYILPYPICRRFCQLFQIKTDLTLETTQIGSRVPVPSPPVFHLPILTPPIPCCWVVFEEPPTDPLNPRACPHVQVLEVRRLACAAYFNGWAGYGCR